MSEWRIRRFWTHAQAVEQHGGYGVMLDQRPVRTPAKAGLVVPTRRMAEAIAQEWNAQDGPVDPATMPFCRSANAAIDKVGPQHGEVADLLGDYGDADLLCYRAESPRALVDRQASQWDPALDWAADALGARLVAVPGLMHKPQDPAAVSLLRARVHGFDAFQLAAFHDLVSLSGSLVLGFAAALDWRPAERIWKLSRLDNIWQEEQWGHDEEARDQAEIKRQAFLHAKRFFYLS